MTTPLPPRNELLALAKQGWSPSPEDRARVASMLGARKASRQGKAKSPPWPVRASAVAALCVLVVGAWLILGLRESNSRAMFRKTTRPERTTLEEREPVIRASEDERVGDAPVATFVESLSPPPRRVRVARRHVPEEAVHESVATAPPATLSVPSLGNEIALIRRADRSIRAGHIAEARSLLTRHAIEFADGALSEERHGLSVVADCTDTHTTAVFARATQFLTDHPESPLRYRIMESCTVRGAQAEPR